MKNNLYLCVLMILSVLSCTPKKQTTAVTPDLLAYQCAGVGKGETLLGVKNTADDVIIEPARFLQIFADDQLLFCQTTEQQVDVFKQNGEELGIFDEVRYFYKNQDAETASYFAINGEFEQVRRGEIDRRDTTVTEYYECLSGHGNVYYFPQENQVVPVKRSAFRIMRFMVLEEADSITIRSHTGHLYWRTQERLVILTDNTQAVPDCIFATVPARSGEYVTVFDFDNKHVKQLTTAQWGNLQKAFTNTRAVSKSGNVSMTQVADLRKKLKF